MKPYAANHPSASHRSATINDSLLLSAGKAPALAEQDGQDFSAIMANQSTIAPGELSEIVPKTSEAGLLLVEAKELVVDMSVTPTPVILPEYFGLPQPQSFMDPLNVTSSSGAEPGKAIPDVFAADVGFDFLARPTDQQSVDMPLAAIDAVASQTQAFEPSQGVALAQKSTWLEPILPTKPKALGLTYADMIHRSTDIVPSTLETFGQRLRTRATDEVGMKLSSYAKEATQRTGTPVDESAVKWVPLTPPILNATKIFQFTEVQQEAPSLSLRMGLSQTFTTDAPPFFSMASIPHDMTVVTHVTAVMQQNVHSPAFQDELVNQVSLWVRESALGNGLMTAELRLNPSDMGPIYVSIELDGLNAQVNFAAQNFETRQALEASYSALSSSLQEAGIKLSGGGVSDQAPQQQASTGFGGKGDDAPKPWQAQPNSQPNEPATATKEHYQEDIVLGARSNATSGGAELDLYA